MSEGTAVDSEVVWVTLSPRSKRERRMMQQPAKAILLDTQHDHPSPPIRNTRNSKRQRRGAMPALARTFTAATTSVSDERPERRTRADPFACCKTPVVMDTGRYAARSRPSPRQSYLTPSSTNCRSEGLRTWCIGARLLVSVFWLHSRLRFAKLVYEFIFRYLCNMLARTVARSQGARHFTSGSCYGSSTRSITSLSTSNHTCHACVRHEPRTLPRPT